MGAIRIPLMTHKSMYHLVYVLLARIGVNSSSLVVLSIRVISLPSYSFRLDQFTISKNPNFAA